MKRTVSIKLLPNLEQAGKLKTLSDLFLEACAQIVSFARENRTWSRYGLHHLAYYSVREALPELGSQMVCNATQKVASAYKVLKANGRVVRNQPLPLATFKKGTVHFDKRTYKLLGDTVSLFTSSGREKIPFVLGKHQINLLTSGEAREADLVCRKGVWYFNLVVNIPDVPKSSDEGILGIDVGENNLAATSTGKVFGGGKLRFERDKYLFRRQALQANGTKASKRKLKAISGKEARHVRHVNHEIATAIVQEACEKRLGKIHMEDLTHIRDNIRAGRRVRTRLHRWAFRQLQTYIEYKAEASGIPVVYVNPAYTSQTCSVCGARGGRVKNVFTCPCGNRGHADVNAAANISGFARPRGFARAAVNQP